MRSLANGNTPCARSQLWALQRSGQGPGSRYQVAASKSMAGDQNWTRKGVEIDKNGDSSDQNEDMPPKKWMFHPENDTIWCFTGCVKYFPNPTPQGKQNIKTWMSKDLNMGGHMENSWKFHEISVENSPSTPFLGVFSSHESGVEALQVDPDLVTYSAAVSSCEKAVRWKLALFLGWNLSFFLNRNSMDDLDGRYIFYIIYIYVFFFQICQIWSQNVQ